MTELMQKLNARNRVEAVLISRKRVDANSIADAQFAQQ